MLMIILLLFLQKQNLNASFINFVCIIDRLEWVVLIHNHEG